MLVLPAPYKRDYCLSVPPPFVPRLIFSSRFSLLEGPKLLVGVLIVIIYIFLALLGLHSCVGFSLVWVSRGHSLAVVRGLLMSAVSLVEEHGL